MDTEEGRESRHRKPSQRLEQSDDILVVKLREAQKQRNAVTIDDSHITPVVVASENIPDLDGSTSLSTRNVTAIDSDIPMNPISRQPSTISMASAQSLPESPTTDSRDRITPPSRAHHIIKSTDDEGKINIRVSKKIRRQGSKDVSTPEHTEKGSNDRPQSRDPQEALGS
ncbi:hypothetical protein AGABI1DRAFT_132864 [Agaricus bisporus var. burnettii JB137-S8]|uniref:Uncharacterized protein n=1 Tax=Agaricus bisporus var. burnettii (strain JB137-S8 / ATCC MYA-4627 / FGSC 10392) TaxID=597362 RepID=K5WVK6_AGABU|nr:uncharacterized protein AGABI1DRAFT_132864 [Agaricus bisporus var. burnettii JB137-S8]EKM74823.1 hypothetical protein AGABI1DRAFT_132864 [Agaricus bisporus var. burnettii JB137-S8]